MADDLFEAAFPYQEDTLALPVTDIDAAARWYAAAFGMTEVERRAAPRPRVIMERSGVQLGFEVNGGDASQDGAALLVTDIDRAHAELSRSEAKVGAIADAERDGERLRAFFVIAPDGLCYYFHQPVTTGAGRG